MSSPPRLEPQDVAGSVTPNEREYGTVAANRYGARHAVLTPRGAHLLKVAVRERIELAAERNLSIPPLLLQVGRWIDALDHDLKQPPPDVEPGLEEILTAAEAARRLGISTRRVQELAADGRIPGARRATGVNGGPGPWLIPAVAVALRGFAHARGGVTTQPAAGTVLSVDPPAPTRSTG